MPMDILRKMPMSLGYFFQHGKHRKRANWDWERAMGEEGCPHPAVFKSLLAGLPVQHVFACEGCLRACLYKVSQPGWAVWPALPGSLS